LQHLSESIGLKMDYLHKALADLIFANEMLKNESDQFSGENAQNFQRIVNDIDSSIDELEIFLRDKDIV